MKYQSIRTLASAARRNSLALASLGILRIGGPFLTFLVSLVVAREMEVEEFGRFTFAMAIFSLFLPVFTLGMDQIVIKSLATRPKSKLPMIEAYATIQLILALIICIIAPISSLIISRNIESMLITLAFCSSYIVRSFTSYEKKLIARNQFNTVGAVSGIACLVACIYTIVVAQLDNVYLMATAFTAYFGVQSAGYWYLARNDSSPPFKMSLLRKTAVRLIHVSGPLFLAGVAVSVYMRLDLIMLLPLSGESETAIYGAASRMTQLLLILPNLIPELLFPRLLKQNSIEAWGRVLRYQFLVGLAITIVGVIVLPSLLTLLFGEKYIASGFYFRMQSLVVPFVCIGGIMSRSLVAEKKQFAVLIVSVTALGLAFILNILLIPTFGGVGACVVMLVTQFWATTGAYMAIPAFGRNRELLLFAIGVTARSHYRLSQNK